MPCARSLRQPLMPPLLGDTLNSILDNDATNLLNGLSAICTNLPSFFPNSYNSSPPTQPARQTTIPRLDPDGHLSLPERVLAHEVGEALVDALDQRIRALHARVREEQEFGPRECLEDAEPEEGGLEGLDACCGLGGVWVRVGGVVSSPSAAGVGGVVGGDVGGGDARGKGFGDGVHAVECAGQDEVVVCAEGLEAGREGAVVD